MSFPSNTPIQFLPGIGIRTAHVLQELGVYTAGQLYQVPEKILVELFGPSISAVLAQFSIQKRQRVVQSARVKESVFARTGGTKKKSFLKRLQLAAQFVSVL